MRYHADMAKRRGEASTNGSASTWGAAIRLLLMIIRALLGRKAAPAPFSRTRRPRTTPQPTSDSIVELFQSHRSDAIVTATGTVTRLLPDDLDNTDGSGKHQQFLVDVPGDVTVKIAHNLAFGRVPVRVGDRVRFRGEYEWNDRGGCVHWTHQDPKGWHADGWIEHNGKRFE